MARAFNLQEYLQEDRLRRFIAAERQVGPVYFSAGLGHCPDPVFALPAPHPGRGRPVRPGLGGGLYHHRGHGRGFLAFLVARYLARDWVAAKISGSRLTHLDEKVAQHGWKIVAFTRLIPVLPFFVVNYAFGLTRITFLPYAIATCFAMLPWTIAFVLVASNLLALLRGQVSIWLVIGVILVAVVSLLPVIFKKVKARQGESVEI